MPHIKEQLIKELGAHKKKHNTLHDQKQRVTRKEQASRSLGRSPNLVDAIMMRLDLLY